MFTSWMTFLAIFGEIHSIFAASAFCSCGQVGNDNASSLAYDLIPGLNASTPGKWCWQLALQSETGSVFCSAVLIDPLYAIAPAQCIAGRQTNTTFLRAGSFDLSTAPMGWQVVPIDRFFVHQGFLNPDTSNEYNIGVIKLQTPFNCSNSNVCLACLPSRNSPAATNQTSCTATTWNMRSTINNGAKPIRARPLRERPASVMDPIDCELAIRGDGAIQSDYRLASSKFCLREATNISHCLGDLGDPLVCLNSNSGRYELIGLNTIGFSCFRPTLPSFYVGVSSFADWISKVIEQSNSSPSIPMTFIVPKSVPSMPSQSDVTVPVVVVVAVNQSVKEVAVATTSTAAPASVGPSVVLLPAASFNGGSPNGKVPQTAPPGLNGFNTQRIAADGTLEQVGADGSVQRQQGLLPTISLLQQVSPGVFRANIGGGFVQVGPSGSQFVFPKTDGLEPVKNATRQRRDNNLASGIIGANSSVSNLNVPVISVSASDVLYDPNTGKFEFRLPQGGSAFSSVSFVPSSADEIRRQISVQQDKILAQVDNLKKNILISISGAFPQFSLGTPDAPSSGVSTFSNANPSPIHTGPRTSSRVTTPPASNNSSNADEDEEESAVVVTSRPVVPVRVASSNGPRPTGIVSSASAGGLNNLNLQASDGGSGGLRTVVSNNAPSVGSLQTSFNSQNGQSKAAIAFQGDRVQGETRHAPGSSFSSVSASSG